jgi:hypothetical protein
MILFFSQLMLSGEIGLLGIIVAFTAFFHLAWGVLISYTQCKVL